MMLARIDAAVDLGNRLHLGENLNGLRLLAKSNTRVDLVYIDPPYGTSNDFLIDEDRANSISASGELAYSDGVMGTEYLDTLAKRLEAIRQIMAIDASIYVHIDVKMEHRVRLLMDDVFGAAQLPQQHHPHQMQPKEFQSKLIWERQGHDPFLLKVPGCS